MVRRENDTEKKKSEILLAALELFIRRGYKATTVRGIARELSMSPGLLFHYFESKEALYVYLVGQSAAFPRRMRTVVTDDPLGFLENEIAALFGEFKQSSLASKYFLLLNQALTSDDVPLRARKIVSHMDLYTVTTSLIRKGQQNKTIREGDPVLLSVAFWSAVKGVAVTAASFPNLGVPESSWILDILRAPKGGASI